MIIEHLFPFQPGRWIGGGKITFSASSEIIRFYTSWMIEKEEDGRLCCVQQVEMQGVDEKVINQFVIYAISEKKFKIDLQSESISLAKGSGVIDLKSVAWEFHGTKGVEGFEVYQLQENGDYMMHAEYSSAELFRTIVDARLWRKNLEGE